MKRRTQILGKEGEDRAVSLLKSRGYRILQRNYYSNYGEIDIVAYERGIIVFLEVKACKSENYGPPELKVNQVKRNRLIKTARQYILEKGLAGQSFRFDVVTLHFGAEGSLLDSEIIQDAFPA